MLCPVVGCRKETENGRSTCEMHYMRMKRNGDYYNLKKRTKPITFDINKDGCFVVNSLTPTKKGYFLITIYGNRRTVHRHIYEECFGFIPEGLVVRHKCDNPGCVNPEHLELGTQMDNVRDAVERDRHPAGSRHGMSKLNERQVGGIKSMLRQGQKNKDLAIIFNVDRDTISNIKTGRIWKKVE